MTYDPQSQSFAPRVSSSKGRWERDRTPAFPIWFMVFCGGLIAWAGLIYAAIHLFGDGAGG